MQAVLNVDTLQGKSGNVPVSSLDGKYVFLYFSAHWCPPCRGFTPMLADFYKANKDAKNFEVVFLSSDREKAEFDGYYAEMPWLAVPFENRDAKAALQQQFQIRGIPSLLLFGPDGKLITADGRMTVMEDPKAENFPWKN
eukprot:PhM_4_TR8853/c0_g1_i1/m.31425/K17609/NXN; nucleoredoxin